MLKDKVKQTIGEYRMFSEGDSVVVGVSGGADSISLLHLLVSLKSDLGLSAIYVAHLNHMLRKNDAVLDQKFVEDISKRLGLEYISESEDVAQFALTNKLSIEDAARRLRYKFYDSAVKRFGADKIALGHSADDSVETFLMRMIRGSGLKGLTGIPPKRGNIVRPIIKIWRREIDHYIAQLKLAPRIDHTNYESKYLRNRVRLNLIPQLKVYNLNIKEILLQTILLLTEDHLYMEAKIKDSISGITIKKKEGLIELDSARLQKLEPPIERHLIRAAIEKVKGDLSNLAFSNIQDIVKNLGQTEHWEIHLPDGMYAYSGRNSLIISKEKPKEYEKIFFNYKLMVPGEVVIGEISRKIKAEITDKSTACEPENTALLDYNNVIDNELVIRQRRDGDRFQPLGMRETKKIQDFFVDLKIPVEDRELVPIIESGGKIIWIAGLRIDDRAKVTKKTKTAVKLTLSKI